jgi:cellulose synthase operon protein C
MTTLSGSRLQAFLDDTDEAVDQQVEAEVDEDIIRAGLITTLSKQTCRADSMNTVYKLHRLWMRAQQTEQALSVLNEQAQAVVQALPADEQSGAQVAIAFWLMSAHDQAKELGQGDAGLRASLHHTEAVLGHIPVADQSDENWNRLASWAHDAGDFELQRRCIKAIHTRELAQAGRAAYRAWDEAVCSLRTGKSFAGQGDLTQARVCAQTTIAALEQAAPDQDVDHLDWLKLSDSLIELFPEGLPAVAKNIRERLPRDASLPVRRGVEVRVARLEAKVAAAQGWLDEALVKAEQGRYGLTEDADDQFSCLMMDWLMQAGRNEAAGRIAFESAFNERPGSAEHAFRLAQAELVKGLQPHPYWALTLACAIHDDELQWLWGEEAPEAFALRHIAIAEQVAPGHTAVAAVQAFHVLATEKNDAKALALLETAVKHPDMASSKNIEQLWFCRMRVHGVTKALKMPVVPCIAGSWCYAIGVALNNQVESELPEGTRFDSNAVEALGAQYYEMGLFRFESFFASGKGHFKDADVHTYSMLCNNLAIYYRYNIDQPQKALPLHHKGIAASPFAEHYNGVMSSYRQIGDNAKYVQAADELWHYAKENGYSRHCPSDYASWVCGALVELNRQAEVPIWLQRLDEWWSEQDDEEKQEGLVSYLGALTSILAKISHTQADDALARLESALPQIQATSDPCCHRLAGLTLENAGQLERALNLFQRATQIGMQDEGDQQQRAYAKEDVERCKKAMKKNRGPWWKVW